MAPPAGQTAAVAEAAGADGAPPQQQRGFGSTISGIVRIAVFWYFASKFFSPKQKPMDPTAPSQLMTNLFHKGESLVNFCSIDDEFELQFIFILLLQMDFNKSCVVL